jgi:hypothetical protein
VFISAGATLSFILPMMPFLYWVMAVSGYFLLIFEAIVAVNLWALSHLRMDGEGISGESGRQGWLMILALFMTPTLMVFGFLIGMALFRVVSDLISAGMFYAVSAIMGNSLLSAIYGIFAYTIFIVLAYMMLLERSFSMIATFPNRVLQWMGARVDIDTGENQIRTGAAGAAVGVNAAGNALERGAGNRERKDMKNGSVVSRYTGAAGAIQKGILARRGSGKGE